MAIHHMNVSTVGRLALARDESERRALLRAFVKTGGVRLFGFGLVDEHAHAGLVCDRPRIVCRDLRRALKRIRPDLEFNAPHLKLVDSRSYLRWLVTYFLRQPAKHGIGVHPALWTGSCFQDLVGARLLPGFSGKTLRAALPRLRLRTLFREVGLEEIDLCPASDELLRRAGAGRLADLAAGVYAMGPTIAGRSQAAVTARALAASLGTRLGFPPLTLAQFLGVSRQAISRLGLQRPDPVAERALRLRFDLEERALRRSA